MSFYKHLIKVKETVQKKLACCTKPFIDQEVLNAQLSAIGEKLDQLDARINEIAEQKKAKKKE